jgi:uncharacterized protein (TIGR03437 family)
MFPDSQINAVVPLAGNPSELRISNNGEISPGFPVVVVDAVPQVFQSPSTSASPISIAVAINEDGTLNSSSNPAPVGSVVSIWATGTGGESLPGAPGQIATAADYSCHSCQITYYDGQIPGPDAYQAEIVYAGAAPGAAAGVTQINFRIPNTVYLAFTLSAGNAAQTSDAVTLFISSTL